MRTLQLDWETEQKRSVSYFNQIMELEKERDQVSASPLTGCRPFSRHATSSSRPSLPLWLQALRSRDSLQLEYTDCLLDKNRLRKRIGELQADQEQLRSELERERERGKMEQSSPGLHRVSSRHRSGARQRRPNAAAQHVT